MGSCAYVLGPPVAALEAAIAGHLGLEHAVSCASGSDALRLCLMALSIGPGDEVIVPSFTFFATAGAVSLTGATPVFCDVLPGTFNMDPERAAELVTARTKAIIAVHLYGQMADMGRLSALSASSGIPLIEDAAQAIGATYEGKPIGSFGLAATLSFFPTKNLGGAGDGGMVVSRDRAFAEKIAMLRVHGSRKRYVHEILGMNSRLDSLQAAVLAVKLKYLDAWTEGRQRHGARYDGLLAGLEASGLLRRPVRDCGAARHVFNQYVILAERRDELRAFLESQGIGSEIYYPIPLHAQQCFKSSSRAGPCPVSERSARGVLALPIFPELTEGQVEAVADAIKGFYSA